MDVVYSLGWGSKNDNAELRWSLRSLEKYGKNLGRVIVVGNCPEWLSDEVIKMPRGKFSENGPKHDNILDAILAVIKAGVVSGEFLYSSDDHFLVKTTDLERFPYYYKRERLRSITDLLSSNVARTGYRNSLADTRTVLEENGYGAKEYSGHVNTHMHCDDAEEVERLWKIPTKHGKGYEPTCLFMNVRAEKRHDFIPVFRKDLKITKPVLSKEDLMDKVGNRETFSIGDGAFKGVSRLKKIMNEMFPDKSRFEK